MLVTVALTSTFPLVFVMERSRFLVAVAVGAVALDVPLTWAFRAAFELEGIAIALALTTFAVLVALSAGVSKRMLVLSVLGLARPAVAVGVLAGLSFGMVPFVLSGFPAAAVGLVLYGALLAVWRPRGLRDAWGYVRALH
jgi:hypothetical protein